MWKSGKSGGRTGLFCVDSFVDTFFGFHRKKRKKTFHRAEVRFPHKKVEKQYYCMPTLLMLEVMSRTMPAIFGSFRNRSSTFLIELSTVV